jgi:hypothetical protein
MEEDTAAMEGVMAEGMVVGMVGGMVGVAETAGGTVEAGTVEAVGTVVSDREG